jgi:16S rRNA (cytidine1402-2'-O)-methyltransferase
VGDTLSELAVAGAGARTAAVARELTKQFEEVRRGTVAELATYYTESPPRGEVVIVVAGGRDEAPSEDALRERARALRAEGLSARDVARRLGEAGAARNLAYRLAHEGGPVDEGD